MWASTRGRSRRLTPPTKCQEEIAIILSLGGSHHWLAIGPNPIAHTGGRGANKGGQEEKMVRGVPRRPKNGRVIIGILDHKYVSIFGHMTISSMHFRTVKEAEQNELSLVLLYSSDFT